MIKNKEELIKYIQIDRIMNGEEKRSIKHIIFPNPIIVFLKDYRKVEYYGSRHTLLFKTKYFFYKKKCDHKMMKLGFSIAYNVFGYGLVIPHYGTIVVGRGNTIGNFCVLHTSTCISEGNKQIGNGLYLSTGAKIIKDINLGDNISIGANSLVNCDFPEGNYLIAGMPAVIKKESEPWYNRDGEMYADRVKKCQEIMKCK